MNDDQIERQVGVALMSSALLECQRLTGEAIGALGQGSFREAASHLSAAHKLIGQTEHRALDAWCEDVAESTTSMMEFLQEQQMRDSSELEGPASDER